MKVQTVLRCYKGNLSSLTHSHIHTLTHTHFLRHRTPEDSQKTAQKTVYISKRAYKYNVIQNPTIQQQKGS